MESQIPGANVITAPENLVGIVDSDIFEIYLTHLTKHLRRVDHRVGHSEMVAVPQRRTTSDIEIAAVDSESVDMPERIVSLKPTADSLDIAAFLDSRFARADNDIFEAQVVRFKQRAFAPELGIFDKLHVT